MAEGPLSAELAEAHALIARQAAEIDRMRLAAADAQFATELRQVLVTAALAGTIAAPVSHSRLLEMIVEAAAQVINSQAASLFLLDDARNELVFEVALGQKASEVRKFRVPLGHGIAGHVAATGQPTATSGGSDPRQAREIAESVGYVPHTILCVPLFYSDRVIGVLELLDKADGTTFSMVDMQVLSLFANLAAVAVEQSRMRENISSVVADMVLDASGSQLTDARRESIVAGLRRLASDIADDQRYQHALGLARLVEEISRAGSRELEVCESVLRSFAEYLRARPRPLAGTLDIDFGTL